MLLTRSFALWFLVFLATGSANALDWSSTTLETRAEPFQKTLTLVFKFKNNRTTSTHLLELPTSCSCLAARSDKKTYAPGEAGQITAEFSTTEPPGIYERHITVVTDEATPPQRLTVRIEIPELATLTPLSREWKINDPVEEKSIELRIAGKLRISFAEAKPSNDSFSARLETIIPEERYLLILKPHSTAARANAAIRIYGRAPDGHEILVNAYANVR